MIILLVLKNVSSGYNEHDILKGISFNVLNGEKICIIGPNGSGKTTLLKAIGGLLKSKGEILLSGKPIAKMNRQEIASKIAILKQNESIYFSYSVYETVMLGRYLHIKKRIFGNPGKYDIDFVMNCLETVGLKDLKNRQISTLSGGQLQRVFLAKALAQDPNLILLDEPTNHLDFKNQIDLIEYLNEWVKTGHRSVIGVLHDINLAMYFADKIMLLSDGKIIKFGDGKSFLDGELLSKTYQIDIKDYMVKTLSCWK